MFCTTGQSSPKIEPKELKTIQQLNKQVKDTQYPDYHVSHLPDVAQPRNPVYQQQVQPFVIYDTPTYYTNSQQEYHPPPVQHIQQVQFVPTVPFTQQVPTVPFTQQVPTVPFTQQVPTVVSPYYSVPYYPPMFPVWQPFVEQTHKQDMQQPSQALPQVQTVEDTPKQCIDLQKLQQMLQATYSEVLAQVLKQLDPQVLPHVLPQVFTHVSHEVLTQTLPSMVSQSYRTEYPM
jgi:hypothetical protein